MSLLSVIYRFLSDLQNEHGPSKKDKVTSHTTIIVSSKAKYLRFFLSFANAADFVLQVRVQGKLTVELWKQIPVELASSALVHYQNIPWSCVLSTEKYRRYIKRSIDQQISNVLMFEQILSSSTIWNVCIKVMRVCLLILVLKGLTGQTSLSSFP